MRSLDCRILYAFTDGCVYRVAQMYCLAKIEDSDTSSDIGNCTCGNWNVPTTYTYIRCICGRLARGRVSSTKSPCFNGDPKGKRPSIGDPAAKAAASANVGGNAASGSEIPAAESLVSTRKPRIAIEEMCGSVPCMPDLPGGHMHANTYMLMRQVVPFVMHGLPGALDGLGIVHEKELVACPPLPITASEKRVCFATSRRWGTHKIA